MELPTQDERAPARQSGRARLRPTHTPPPSQVGFTAREGAVLHAVKLNGRPVAWRLSFAEMVVPCERAPYTRAVAIASRDARRQDKREERKRVRTKLLVLIGYFTTEI